MVKGTGLTDKTDAELISLIGQAHAIIADRARARNREFQTVVDRCSAPALHAGKLPDRRAALAERGGADPSPTSPEAQEDRSDG